MLSKQESRLSDDTAVLLAYARGAKKRRRILQALQLTPRNCNQLSQEMDSDWWTIQKHLQRLVTGGLIVSVNFGHTKFYRLTVKGELALNMSYENSKCSSIKRTSLTK